MIVPVISLILGDLATVVINLGKISTYQMMHSALVNAKCQKSLGLHLHVINFTFFCSFCFKKNIAGERLRETPVKVLKGVVALCLM